MDKLERFIERDSFAQHLGIEVLAGDPVGVRVRMELGPQHLNGLGSLHGGAIFSLADVALAAASNSDARAVAINASICFFKAVTEGVVTAEAREVAVSSRLATYLVDVRQEGRSDLVAQVQGTVFRKSAGRD